MLEVIAGTTRYTAEKALQFGAARMNVMAREVTVEKAGGMWRVGEEKERREGNVCIGSSRDPAMSQFNAMWQVCGAPVCACVWQNVLRSGANRRPSDRHARR